MDCPEGELKAEVLSRSGEVIEPFTIKNCKPVSCDKTLVALAWKEDLVKLSGEPVRFRFFLKNGSIYSFWVSPEKNGASYGYVGGGGPKFTAATDTVGNGE